jgi:hypothetical protein
VKVYIEEEIATIKKHRRSKFTQHILSLSLPLNSILCLLSQGFVSIIVANNLRKCNRARHDGIRRDRQTDRKKKRLDDSQEMPSSVMSAILQVQDITFTVTSSMIRTFHSGEPFPVLAACSISCRRRSRDVWRKVRNPPAPCEEESDRLMFAAAAASS